MANTRDLGILILKLTGGFIMVCGRISAIYKLQTTNSVIKNVNKKVNSLPSVITGLFSNITSRG